MHEVSEEDAEVTCSSRGIALIQQFEDCELSSYRDIGGVWTVGYGHTRDAHPEQHITQEEAMVFLRDDLRHVEGVLTAAIKRPVTQSQFDACCALAFNIGVGNFTRSTLLQRLNSGDTAGAAAQFAVWNKATVNGQRKEVAGLTRRRAAEAELFVT